MDYHRQGMRGLSDEGAARDDTVPNYQPRATEIPSRDPDHLFHMHYREEPPDDGADGVADGVKIPSEYDKLST